MKRWLSNWWHRADVARVSVVRASKSAAGAVHKVAAQGLLRSRATGEKLAQRIISVQRMAGASDKMIRESARSVLNRPMTRHGDAAWQLGYKQAVEARIPELREKVPARAPEGPKPEQPDRPAWPHTAGPIDPSLFRDGPDKEAGK